MEYPYSKLTKRWRQGILITMIILFFLISPVVVSYAMGYRYNLSGHFWRATGSLSIDIMPKSSRSFLDEMELTKNTINKKVELNNLKSGKYQLKIILDGYFDWTKEIVINDKQTTYIKEINLIKKSPIEKINEQAAKQISLSPKFDYLFFTVNASSSQEIWLKKLSDGSTVRLSSLPFDQTINFSWNNQNCAVFYYQTDFIQAGAICPALNNNIVWLNQINKQINKIIWDTTNKNDILYSDQKNIYRFNIINRQTTKISTNNFMDWLVEDGHLWSLTFNTNTLRYEIYQDKSGSANLFASFADDLSIVEKGSSPAKLLVAKNNNVIVKYEQKNLLLNNQKYFEFSQSDFYISPYNDWWLMWTPWELRTYIEGAQPELQLRSGEELRQVIPLDEYNALGLVWKNKMSILFPYYQVSHDLINESIVQAVSDSKNRVLYFIRKNQTGLWQIKY
ncbi:MAG: hypothetical protein COU31_02445 [Candidatus Magasanikbacteria bacterium CG10_big_fil_rev_8_21_14_0_10_40_10]|uniref:PEGA domain-containing protein n=1 Tax=Candidatus Magasanikbacteria bacterium CG10_big_fil_rev_8_21_14_0_10_40_10 TaxID=1974648 RepID=A0A2M6W461_9BACT|nr:MAG: hypothetical protein COU31_02445 [Candidatus Magasanikbacteria bacterium CG10_big_fil_rev_8_21_14_0_10_40_10]